MDGHWSLTKRAVLARCLSKIRQRDRLGLRATVISLSCVAVALALTATLVSVGVPGFVPRASATVGCVGSACDGQDAVAMGCDTSTPNPQELGSISDGSAWTMEIVYAPACHAAWARIAIGEVLNGGALQLWYTNPFGGRELLANDESTICSGGCIVVTTMRSWDESVKACVNFFEGADPDPVPDPGPGLPADFGQCTSWF